jgi:predicted cupin superfamily sugar epimerase
MMTFGWASARLVPHPEGGWFKETWRSGLTMPYLRCRRTAPGLAKRRHRNPVPAHARSAVGVATCSAELWLHHFGGRCYSKSGRTRQRHNALLGADILAGEQLEIVVLPDIGSGLSYDAPARSTVS